MKTRLAPRICACGVSFVPDTPGQRYCSLECRYGEYACENCGDKRLKKPNSANRFCSKECWYEAKRGRRVDAEGYVLVTVGKDVPGARSDGRILEHRLVVSKDLGRSLAEDERVVHRNRNRADNRRENLLVVHLRSQDGSRGARSGP